MLRRVLGVFAGGALWGAAAAVLESALYHRWYHVAIEPVANKAELVVNTALLGGLVGLVALFSLGVILPAVTRGRSVTGAGERAASAARSSAGAGLVVLVILNYLRMGPLGAVWSSPVGKMTMLAGALVGFGAFSVAIYRAQIGRAYVRRTVYALLAIFIAGSFVWGVALGPFGLASGHGKRKTDGAHPGIILIVTDTERADFLDCYGASWNASPATDRVAREGVLFENEIAQSSWTLPSTASLLSGQFPSSHGANSKGRPLSPESPYLPEILRRSGYRTGVFSENFHILPRNGFGRGVDAFNAPWFPWVFDHALVYNVSERLHLPTLTLADKNAFPDPVTRPDQVNWDARVLTDHALSWLNSLDDGEPFFAYLHYMGPHGPYGPPEYLLDVPKPPVAVTDHPKDKGGGLPLGERGAPVDDESLRTMKTLYAADIRYVEENIGRLFDWLDASGRADDTIVVLTSDHGEEFYDHGAWNHGGSAYNEVVRVPLVVRAPGVSRAGTRVADYTRHIDVLPTLLDLAGIEPPPNIQGRSLRPLLDGRAMAAIPAYVEAYPLRPPGCSIFAISDSSGKMIRVSLGQEMTETVFDLGSDPHEQTDVGAARETLYDRLLREMELWERAAGMYAGETAPVPIDPATMKKLKSLGYVD